MYLFIFLQVVYFLSGCGSKFPHEEALAAVQSLRRPREGHQGRRQGIVHFQVSILSHGLIAI